ncbi:(2Fe-2S)-binding protein [Pseudomonas lini]
MRFLRRPRRADPDQHRGRCSGRQTEKRKKAICGCSDLNHGQIRQAIRDQHLLTIAGTMSYLNWRTPNGCATCRPALNYYLISTWPGEAKDDPQSRLINERAHANIQKDGTYSIVPRMWGGVTNPSELRRIADVADKYNVPMVKVTGGQRIDLLGIKKSRTCQASGKTWTCPPATPTANPSAR